MQEIGKSQFLFSSLPHSIYQNQHCRSCRSRDNETHFSWSVYIYDVAQAFQPAGFGDFPVASFLRTEHGTRMSGYMKSVSKVLRCLRGLRAPFWERERTGQIFGDCRVAAGGGRGVIVVGLRQGLGRAFARRHQLFQGRFQFSFSHRHLPDFERAPDAAAVAVQEINDGFARRTRRRRRMKQFQVFVHFEFVARPNCFLC